jgi:ribosomal protein S12 methylthiotransferase
LNNQKSRTYFIDPFGCAKNQVDAETMMAHLDDSGWKAAVDPETADVIIVNSCGFIESAKRESINAVLDWKNKYPDKKVLLAGCLAQRYRAELEESLVEADGFLGCTELDRAPEKAAALLGIGRQEPAAAGAGRLTEPGTATAGKSRPQKPRPISAGERPLLGFAGSAYVKISEGCNNGCSFCAIPLIRGPLRCRAIPDIVEECKLLVARGVKELCLIGQDLASYNPANAARSEHAADGLFVTGAADCSGRAPGPAGPSGLASLLEAIAVLPGDFWVRLLYLHPDHVPLDILDSIAKDKRFLPYFDIPFQHASRPILSAMGRRGDTKTYLALLDAIRARLPDAVIRSTFMVGFPGETEEDFAALLDFQAKARFDWLGVFTFSREEGTAAWSMKNRVNKKTAAQRKALVEEKQMSITEKNMDRFVGRTLDALVEEKIDDDDVPPAGDSPGAAPSAVGGSPDDSAAEHSGLWLGRLFCQAPEVDGAAVISRVSLGGSSAVRPSSWQSPSRQSPSGQSPSGHSPSKHRLRPGDMIRGTVVARAGFDLELRV